MYIINIMVLYEINIFNCLRTALLKLILLFGNFVGNYKKLQKGTLGLPQKKNEFFTTSKMEKMGNSVK